MDAQTRAHIRRERDRIVRTQVRWKNPNYQRGRPKEWPPLVEMHPDGMPDPRHLRGLKRAEVGSSSR